MSRSNGKVPKNLGQRNLKRGNVPQATLRAAEDLEAKPARQMPSNPGGNIETVFAARERDKQVKTLAVEDPERVQEELYAEMSLQVMRLTRKLNRTGGPPDRIIIEAWRELRQAGLVVLEIRRSRGSLAEAADFFAELEQRMENLEDTLLADVVVSAIPMAEIDVVRS